MAVVRGRRMVVFNNTDVTVDEAAVALGLNPQTIHTWVYRGHIQDRGYREMPEARPRKLVDLEEVRDFAKSKKTGVKLSQ